MGDPEKLLNLRRVQDFSKTKNFSFEDVSPPDYLSMFVSSEEEIADKANKYMQFYNHTVETFKEKTTLTTLDIGILMLAAMLQTSRWVIAESIKTVVEKSSTAYKKISDNNTRNFTEFIPATVNRIADDLEKNRVSYDVSDKYVKALGHNPIAGLIVGTANIATNTLTLDDFYNGLPSYHVVDRQIARKTDFLHVIKWTGEILLNDPKIIGAAFIRQMFQCGEDFFDKLNLPPIAVKNISPEMSEFLTGEEIKELSLAALVNKVIEMCHKIFFDPRSDDARLYEVRTRKILTYSNTLSSMLNVSYVGLSGSITKTDVGGIWLTLMQILNNHSMIRQIELDFINRTLDNAFQKEEDEINQQLAKLGFSI